VFEKDIRVLASFTLYLRERELNGKFFSQPLKSQIGLRGSTEPPYFYTTHTIQTQTTNPEDHICNHLNSGGYFDRRK